MFESKVQVYIAMSTPANSATYNDSESETITTYETDLMEIHPWRLDCTGVFSGTFGTSNGFCHRLSA